MSLDIRKCDQIFDFNFPAKVEELDTALFPLHRQIERQYRDLPWPEQVQNIVVYTKVVGGKGDIAAAAKTITLMQKICPTLNFDWVLYGQRDQSDPVAFLSNCKDLSKIHIRECESSSPPEKKPADMLITGPVRLSWDKNYIAGRIFRKISGPMFSFLEIALDASNRNHSSNLKFFIKHQVSLLQQIDEKITYENIYKGLHQHVFLSESDNIFGGSLPMGITSDSGGVFLDPNRKNALLSRGYCCPSLIQQIQDDELRKDLLDAMDVLNAEKMPDYDLYSLNFGYAHHNYSRANFIDCVAIHEKNKNIVIVLNQNGAYERFSTSEFLEEIFTEKRLAFLKEKGYGFVCIKGKEKEPTTLQIDENQLRQIRVIVRPTFVQNDMLYLQLASERLMATGDNSAVEAWCSKCKLYLYENIGFKSRFLKNQVDLAATISPILSRLLELFGDDDWETSRENKMVEMEKLLNDPNLEDATLTFCDQLTSSDHSFEVVLQGALKRTAWHHCIPKLAEVEAVAFDPDFQKGLIDYIQDPITAPKNVKIRNLNEIGASIQKTIKDYVIRY